MESLVNKRVRLQNKYTNTFLVARSDKESVKHVSFGNEPKPENSVWLIKSKDPNKSVRLESVYGKVLGCKYFKDTHVLTVCQVDKKADVLSKWWTLEDVDNCAFTCVRINMRRCVDKGIYLIPDPDNNNSCVKMRIIKIPWWGSWVGIEEYYHWKVQIVDRVAPTPDQTGEPSAGSPCIQHIEHMDVRNIFKNSNKMPLPFGNVNTGGNKNESGIQIIGSATVNNQIDRSVHQAMVGRNVYFSHGAS